MNDADPTQRAGQQLENELRSLSMHLHHRWCEPGEVFESERRQAVLDVTFTKPARLDFGEQVTCEPEFGRMDGALSRQLHRNRVLQ